MSRADSPLRHRMIFLVGARRSGTNWLQRVVGAHPEVASIPSETYLFSRGVRPLRERFHHGIQSSPGPGFLYMDEQELLDALRDFCDRALLPYLEAAPAASRLVERTPEHVACLDLIGSVYPDSYVVHIIRDGRDVARSLLNQTWTTAPKTIEDAAEEWRSSIEAAENAAHAVQRYRVLRYEELLGDPLRHVTELYSWLGLAASAPVVEAALVEAEVRYNVDPGAPEVASGKWRSSFSAGDEEAFMRVAGQTLSRLGYETTAGAPAVETGGSFPEAERPKKRRLGRKKPESDDDDGPLEHRVLARAAEIQRLLDQVTAAINTRRIEQLAALASPSIMVRVVSPRDDWKARGPAALARLGEVIEGDEALRGRQFRGDLHIAVPTASAVLTFHTRGGETHIRVIVATFSRRDALTRLTYYQLPLGEP